MFGVKDLALGEQLLNEQALLLVLQAGDCGTLRFKSLTIHDVGEDRADHRRAVRFDLRGSGAELAQEGFLGCLPRGSYPGSGHRGLEDCSLEFSIEEGSGSRHGPIDPAAGRAANRWPRSPSTPGFADSWQLPCAFRRPCLHGALIQGGFRAARNEVMARVERAATSRHTVNGA